MVDFYNSLSVLQHQESLRAVYTTNCSPFPTFRGHAWGHDFIYMFPRRRYLVCRSFSYRSHELTSPSSVTGALSSSLPIGINPFWKLSFVFKCLTDSVVLDDFKTALDRLRAFKITKLGSFAVDNGENGRTPVPNSANGWGGLRGPDPVQMPLPSPDADELSHPRPWPEEKPDLSQFDLSKRKKERNMSQFTGSSTERNASDSPIMRPQSSWLRDSGEMDYARAVREVTRSSHGESHHPEPDAGIGTAR